MMIRVLAFLLALAPGLAWGQNISGPFYSAGTGIGQILGPLVNFQSSGHPGLQLSDRLIFGLSPTSPTYFTAIQIKNATGALGGLHSNINQALYVTSDVNAADATAEWNLTAICTTSGTVGGECLGGYLQGNRNAGSTDKIWGGVIQAADFSDAASTGIGSTLGLEVDFGANLLDTAANPTMYTGAGNRVGLQMVAIRQTASDVNDTEFAQGLWFTTASLGGTTVDAHVFYDSFIGAGVNVQVKQALDVRGAIIPTGYGGSLADVWGPTNSVIYMDTAGTSSASLSKITSTGSNFLFTMNGFGLSVANTANAANGVLITPSVTGSDPVIQPYGDASRNLKFSGAGSGNVGVLTTLNAGQGSTDFVQIAGSSTSPSISAVGGNTNIDFIINSKGTGNIEFGTASAWTANGAVATAMTSVGPTGSHTTVQEWFTVKDSGGTVRYVPAF